MLLGLGKIRITSYSLRTKNSNSKRLKTVKT